MPKFLVFGALNSNTFRVNKYDFEDRFEFFTPKPENVLA